MYVNLFIDYIRLTNKKTINNNLINNRNKSITKH